jgi:Lrp/AsnC family leucine-responsive transcriptional regulator
LRQVNTVITELAEEKLTDRRIIGSETFVSIDEIDRAILAALEADARVRTSALARQVGLSAPAVAERLRRLEDTRVVSYHAEAEPRALGYPVCAIVRISPTSTGLQQIPQTARDTPEITECYRVTGDDCYIMKLYLRSMDDLEAILDRFTRYGRTTTSIVHSTPVPRRPLPIDGVGGNGQHPR